MMDQKDGAACMRASAAGATPAAPNDSKGIDRYRSSQQCNIHVAVVR